MLFKELHTQMGKYKNLTKEEEIELGKKKDTGDKKARELLIKSNLRLVFSIAQDIYQNCGKMTDNNLEDMFQDGVAGLITAVDKYDWKQNAKVSTMATEWIRLYIIRGINFTGRNIIIPTQKFLQLKPIQEAIQKLQEEKGRTPDPKEIYEYLQKEDLINRVSASTNEEKQLETVQDCVSYLNLFQTSSLNQPGKTAQENNNDDSELGDSIADDSIDINQYISRNSVHELIMESLASPSLGERERTVIKLRYGLEGDECRTFDEVCKIYGVSRQRMQQIEVVALDKLKCVLIGKVITNKIQQEIYPLLSLDEKKIFSYRFGINGTKSRTIEHLARKLDKDPKEVIQIEHSVLRKLRPYFEGGIED